MKQIDKVKENLLRIIKEIDITNSEEEKNELDLINEKLNRIEVWLQRLEKAII
jgi:hypothetical protein